MVEEKAFIADMRKRIQPEACGRIQTEWMVRVGVGEKQERREKEEDKGQVDQERSPESGSQDNTCLVYMESEAAGREAQHPDLEGFGVRVWGEKCWEEAQS